MGALASDCIRQGEGEIGKFFTRFPSSYIDPSWLHPSRPLQKATVLSDGHLHTATFFTPEVVIALPCDLLQGNFP